MRDPTIYVGRWTVLTDGACASALSHGRRPHHGLCRHRPHEIEVGPPRPHTTMPTILRSRKWGQGVLRASVYQYVPKYLLDKRSSYFDLMPAHMLTGATKGRLPVELRSGWMLLASNLVSAREERAAEYVSTWISRHGPDVGSRMPHVGECGRANG